MRPAPPIFDAECTVRRENWTVGDDAIRPMGSRHHCFYCGEPRGGEHREGCTIRSRTVVVEIKVELVVSVPEDWDEHLIEFWMNDGSRCASGIIDDIAAMDERLDGDHECPCNFVAGRYLREATPEDEAGQKFFIANEES